MEDGCLAPRGWFLTAAGVGGKANGRQHEEDKPDIGGRHDGTGEGEAKIPVLPPIAIRLRAFLTDGLFRVHVPGPTIGTAVCRIAERVLGRWDALAPAGG